MNSEHSITPTSATTSSSAYTAGLVTGPATSDASSVHASTPTTTNGTSGSTNNSLLTIVRTQIAFLFSTLTETNYERNQLEIRSLSEQHGVETYLHFIRRLIGASQQRLVSTAAPAAFDSSSSLTFRLLVQEIQRLARDPFLADRFREAIDKGESDVFRHFDVVRFADRVGLRPLERLILAASIVAAPTRRELHQQALQIIRVDFDNAVIALCSHPSFDHADLSRAQVGKLLANLLSDPPSDTPVLDSMQRLAIILAVQTKYGPETTSTLLQGILPTLSLPPGTSLVQTLIQLGPDITSDSDTVRALLERFGISDANPPRDVQVVEIVSTLARLAAEGAQLCDVGSLIRAINSFRVPLHWASVIRAFDRPERHGVDTATLKLLIAILMNSPRDVESPAVAGFWMNWNNALYQLRLLDALLSLPSDTFNFVSLPGRRIVTVDDVASASPTIKALAANVQGHTWNSLELFETLVRLGDSESMDIRLCVREMLDKAVKISAELVHMGLLQVPKPWNSTQTDYAAKLLAMFLAGHPNHQLVFMRIWQIDPQYLTNAFRDFYAESALNITRILDVAQDLKILDSLLDVRPFVFALDVAALASRREYLNLDKWLADNINTHGEDFVRAVMDFLDLKVKADQARIHEPGAELRTMSINAHTVAIFIRVIRNYMNTPAGQSLPKADHEYMIQIRNACLQLHPRLMNLAPGSEQEPGLSVVSFPPDVEAEVDGIYKQMYDEHMSIDHVISVLQRAKASTNPRDHEIFACALHTLFDEYRFLTSYPTRELLMTAYLFGSLIQYQLIDYIPLGIAIRYVIEALKEPPESKMFQFGVQALSRFEQRLPEWEPLCQALLEIPHLQSTRPDLTDSARRALIRTGDSIENGADGSVSAVPDSPALAFTSIRADRNVEVTFTTPEEELSDKILFIINNLAPNNFDPKLAEMRDLFQDAHSRWFANYLVDQRVSTEPNNHKLYLRFLDALNRPLLAKFVLHETFIKSGTLLNAELTLQSGSERTILKNLGSWLGSITLARNQPIKFVNLSFKDLLLEGYDNNRLIVAIPFVCKILEQCAESEVFQPPNPWLMAVIGLLSELYHYGELRLNLKFEIEVLCRSLNIDLERVETTTILRDRPLTEPFGVPALPDEVPDMDALPIGGYDHGVQMQGDQQLIPLGTASAGGQLTVHMENVLSSIPSLVAVNVMLAPWNTNAMFKTMLATAVENAVREIILPVVERSVTIASLSTRELVTKDFALEGNEDKMRKAAHLMATRLAGSLALVTCKEPLRSNMANHLRQSLADHGFHESAFPEPAINMMVMDNLDIACSAIEHAAMDRAIADIDEGLAAAYESRRRHREQRSGIPFWDQTVPPSQFVASLPDPLRIKASGLSFQQTRVYEEFGQDATRRHGSRPGSSVAFNRDQVVPGSYASSAATPDPMDRVPSHLTNLQAMDSITQLLSEVETSLAQTPDSPTSTLPANHILRLLFRRILSVVEQSADRESIALHASQKVVHLLYKTPSGLGRDLAVMMLERLCDSFPKVAKEAVEWLLYAEDERKFNVPVTVALLRRGIISFADEDLQLAKLIIRDYHPHVINFTINLIRECISGETPLALRTQFLYCLEALGRASQTGKATEESTRFLEELRGVRRPSQPLAPPAVAPSQLAAYDQLAFFFSQWVRAFQSSSSSDKAFYVFVGQLTSHGVLKGEEISSLFFRVCTEVSVDSYNKAILSGDFTNAFQAVDALSRLIVLLIKYHGDEGATNNDAVKFHYLTKILSIVVLVLAHHHEQIGVEFPQKPFFRFFSTLLNDLHSIESNLQTAYFQLLLALCDTLNTLQPTYFPGFAFSWISLVSHRLFMPKLLLSQNREGWHAYHRLVICLFRFLGSFLRTADIQDSSRNLVKGTLRLLLVLIHDFPEFLCEHYFSLCDAIPPRCIQLRNVILSAYPASVMLPDASQRNLKLDSIPEMGIIPPILSDFTSGLKNGDLRGSLDQYLLNRGSPSFLVSLKERLLASDPRESSVERYNLSVINALVMYVGVSSVAQAKARSGAPVFVPSDPGVVLLQFLASNLDPEGQHHLLNSIMIHLRYPNAHTHWFSSLMLFLFAEVKDDRFREIMTKVFLERFIGHRPHPWGALVTFIELLRNSKYEFWNRDFIRISPEILMILENIFRAVI